MVDFGMGRLWTHDRGFDKHARYRLQPFAFYLVSVKAPP